MQTIEFDFFGDTLVVHWDGNVWLSPSNGQQHSTIGEAVRAECVAYLRSCGDESNDFADAISCAIDDADAAQRV